MATVGVMRDPILVRYETANHEAAHAVGHWLRDHPIKEVSISHPDSWVAGWVVSAHMEVLLPEGTVDPIKWLDGHYEKTSRQMAAIARVGGLVGGQDWEGPECSVDRSNVFALRPKNWLSLSLMEWEGYALLLAEDLLEDPRFKPALRALSRALLDTYPTDMSGDEAFRIMDASTM